MATDNDAYVHHDDDDGHDGRHDRDHDPHGKHNGNHDGSHNEKDDEDDDDDLYDMHDSHHDTESGASRTSLDTSTTTDTSPDRELADDGHGHSHSQHHHHNTGHPTRIHGQGQLYGHGHGHEQGNGHRHGHGRGPSGSTSGSATTSISEAVFSSSSPRQRLRDSHMGSPHRRSHSGWKPDSPSTPPSRRTSLRSSRLSTPTTFVSRKQDRVRYSWQSLPDDDEPGKPRIHVIKIVSTASTASAGIGQEEAFGFSCSAGGKRIAVYNSARLFILQTAALPVNVSQEYALKRRPLAVEIVDEENILAVLADEHTVNVYDISHHSVRRLKTIRPDHPANTIALSRTGALLAAAYEGGAEIFSLAESALSTDRRAIRCPRMDKLHFSDDGSTLLGTTTRLHASSTVVVSVPVFPAAVSGEPTHDELKEAWCAGLLSPENIRNSSHATFWREHGHLTNEKLFAWNGLEDTFGVLNTTHLDYNNIACPIGVSQPLSAVGGLGAAVHSVPSVDESGTSIAMIVNQTTVRIYTVPPEVPEDDTRIEAHSMDHELNDEYGNPFADVRWVHSHKTIAPAIGPEPRTRGRLIVTSPGGMFDSDTAEQNVQDIEGGRIIIFDFDPQYAGQPGQMFTFTLGKAPPLVLAEETLDVATEVDLVRRRTITQNRGGTLGHRPPSLGRTATTMSRRREERLTPEIRRSPNLSNQPSSIQNTPTQENFPTLPFSQFRGGRRASLSLTSLSTEASRSLPDLLEASELAYEEPYTQGAPRSGPAIQRATTAANRRRFQALEEREAEEADPEGVPLPTYSEEPNQPLPSKYRRLAGLDIPQTGRILYNTEATTAPPVLSESYPDEVSDSYPTHSSFLSRGTSSNASSWLTQRSHTNTYGVSPSGSTRMPISVGDWENVSPTLSRMPTNRSSLRHQASWETVGTQRHYAASQNSLSPISRTTTRATLRSQRSFDTRSPSSSTFDSPPSRPPVPLQSQPPLPSQRPQTPTRNQPSDQEDLNFSPPFISDFRHSLLLPLDTSFSDSTLSTAGLTDFDSAVSTRSNGPSSPSSSYFDVMTSNSNGAALSNANHYATPARQTPFQRAASASALALAASNSSANIHSAGLTTPNSSEKGVSAGSVPHPITNWYPPAPSAPPPATPSSPHDPIIPSGPPLSGKTYRADSAADSNISGGSLENLSIHPEPKSRAHSVPLPKQSTTGTTDMTVPNSIEQALATTITDSTAVTSSAAGEHDAITEPVSRPVFSISNAPSYPDVFHVQKPGTENQALRRPIFGSFRSSTATDAPSASSPTNAAVNENHGGAGGVNGKRPALTLAQSQHQPSPQPRALSHTAASASSYTYAATSGSTPQSPSASSLSPSINFSRKDVKRSKGVGYGRFPVGQGDGREGVGVTSYCYSDAASASAASAGASAGGMSRIGTRGSASGSSAAGIGAGAGRDGNGRSGGRDTQLGDRYQTRAEFREIEGQGKRCVVM